MATIAEVRDRPRIKNPGLGPLRDAVGETVGSVFYGTLLKTMRESKLKGKYGHGGRGEEVFAGQLDAIVAGEMGKATRGGVAEALFRTLERQQVLVNRAAQGRGVTE